VTMPLRAELLALCRKDQAVRNEAVANMKDLGCRRA